MNENINPSTVQISQPTHFKLKQISIYCDIPQSTIIDMLIEPVYNAVKQYFSKVMETGDIIDFDLVATAQIAPDMVFGVFSVPMDNSPEKDAEIMQQRDEMINEQFNALKRKKEKRKEDFQEQKVNDSGKPKTAKLSKKINFRCEVI